MGVLNKIKNFFVEEVEEDEEDEEEVREPEQEQEQLARKVELPKKSFRERFKLRERLEEEEDEEEKEEVEETKIELEEQEPNVYIPKNNNFTFEEEEINPPKEEVTMEEEPEEFPSRSSRIPLVFEDDNLFQEEEDYAPEVPEVQEEEEEEEEPTPPPREKYKPPLLYQGRKESNYIDSIKKETYSKSKKEDDDSDKKFRPSPIISPIYGILDKNYRKEEVIDRKDRPSSYVSRKNADLDSIRQKAYGIKEEVEEKKEEPVVIDEDLPTPPVYDDINYDYDIPAVDQVTVGDAEEYFNDLGLEYNIDYKDRHYENATGRRSDAYISEEKKDLYDEVVINDNNSIESNNSDDNITMDDLMSSQLKEIDQEEAHLEDNLFDLVDSLYEDGE